MMGHGGVFALGVTAVTLAPAASAQAVESSKVARVNGCEVLAYLAGTVGGGRGVTPPNTANSWRSIGSASCPSTAPVGRMFIRAKLTQNGVDVTPGNPITAKWSSGSPSTKLAIVPLSYLNPYVGEGTTQVCTDLFVDGGRAGGVCTDPLK